MDDLYRQYPADRLPIEAQYPADKGGKVRLPTLSDLDRRTKAAQLTFRLCDDLISDLGGANSLSSMELELVEATAVMGAMRKAQTTILLSGGGIDTAQFLAICNAQRRHLEALQSSLLIKREIKGTVNQTVKNISGDMKPSEAAEVWLEVLKSEGL